MLKVRSMLGCLLSLCGVFVFIGPNPSSSDKPYDLFESCPKKSMFIGILHSLFHSL